MKQLINFWAVLTLLISGFLLFTFFNILLKGIVSFTEPNIWILIPETLMALFMFVVSFYVAYQILFRKKDIKLVNSCNF